MTEPGWILEGDARAIHARLLSLDGGAHGLRDAGLLSSASARPRHHFAYGDETDVVRLAAHHTEAIVRNHPFVDGNKRVGFVIGVLFLELHGYVFTAPQPLATHAVLDLAAGRSGLEGYVRFLRDHTRPAPAGR